MNGIAAILLSYWIAGVVFSIGVASTETRICPRYQVSTLKMTVNIILWPAVIADAVTTGVSLYDKSRCPAEVAR